MKNLLVYLHECVRALTLFVTRFSPGPMRTPAFALEARHTAFLARTPHTAPTLLCVLSRGSQSLTLAAAWAVCRSFCYPPVTAFRPRHSHFIFSCNLIVPALTARSILQCTRVVNYENKFASDNNKQLVRLFKLSVVCHGNFGALSEQRYCRYIFFGPFYM